MTQLSASTLPSLAAVLPPRRYRHIIWDWNGTLLDDVEISVAIMDDMLRRRGLPGMDLARYHSVFDFPVRAYYGRLGLETSEENFRALSAEFIGGYERRRLEAQLHRDVEAVLGSVVANGMTQSILSAYQHDTLCEIVAHFGLRPHFVQLAGLDNIYAQSKVALGRASLADLQIPPAEVLLIGDTLHDLDVATDLGVDCILVAHGHQPASRLRARCDRVFSDLKSVAAQFGLTLQSVAARDCARR